VAILSKQSVSGEITYNCTATVYTNISGLITVRIDDAYRIHSYNPTFARLIFGYDDKELLEAPITSLIPNFFEADTNATLMMNESHAKNIDETSASVLAIRGSFGSSSRALNSIETSYSLVKLSNENHESKESAKKSDNDFDFKYSTLTFSPNTKCLNFINSNSFSSSPKSLERLNHIHLNINQSNIKKSLLVKAISNNNNLNQFDQNRLNQSISDDIAGLNVSNACSFKSTEAIASSPCSSVTSSPSSYRRSSFGISKYPKMDELYQKDEDSVNSMNESIEKPFDNKNGLTDDQELSEVCIISNEEDTSSIEEDCLSPSKRKVNFEDVGDSNANLNLNTSAQEQPIEEFNENKKLKSQVTSTPAAGMNTNSSQRDSIKQGNSQLKYSLASLEKSSRSRFCEGCYKIKIKQTLIGLIFTNFFICYFHFRHVFCKWPS
jgi:hypothetical protein